MAADLQPLHNCSWNGAIHNMCGFCYSYLSLWPVNLLQTLFHSNIVVDCDAVFGLQPWHCLLHMRQFLSHPMSWDAASFHWVGVRFWNIYFVTASQFAVINFPFHHFFFGHPKWCHDHWKLVNWWVDPWIFCSINNGDDPTLFVGRFLWFVKIYHGIQTTTSTFKQRKKITQMHCWVVVTEFVIWMCMCSWANDKWIKSYGNLRCCDISVRELLKPARRHWKRLVPFL